MNSTEEKAKEMHTDTYYNQNFERQKENLEGI